MDSKPFASRGQRATLLGLQRDALRYFLDSQHDSGLMLDRQANWGRRRRRGLCSLAATGMGLIALALASKRPHRLLTPGEAAARARRALEAAAALPHTLGVLPHFVRARDLAPVGADRRSTIDTGWLLAGGLSAAALLGGGGLARMAEALVSRVEWDGWVGPSGRIAHGHDRRGRFLGGDWDRLNGETLFLYVLAAGGPSRARLPGGRPAAAGRRCPNARLGLFVSQYSLELIDVTACASPRVADLARAAGVAVEVNRAACRARAGRFATYRRFWGLSAGDGPPAGRGREAYRDYAPAGPIDGTAHLTATLASIAHRPDRVWENLAHVAGCPLPVRGRYGLSNVNLDRGWRSPDVVGIDLGAAALALDNALHAGRVREAFMSAGPVAAGLRRLGLPQAPMAISGNRPLAA